MKLTIDVENTVTKRDGKMHLDPFEADNKLVMVGCRTDKGVEYLYNMDRDGESVVGIQELLDATNQIVTKSNKAELTLEFINGSSIQFLSAERYDSIRGFSFNYMVVDEAAFIKEQAMNEAIFPTLSAIGKKCLIISTPKSKNWFYNLTFKITIYSII